MSDVQDLLKPFKASMCCLLLTTPLSSIVTDESQRAEIPDNIKRTLENITATKAALDASLVGVNTQVAATLNSDAINATPMASNKADDSPGYKRLVSTLALSSPRWQHIEAV
jgi:hypothetical protein